MKKKFDWTLFAVEIWNSTSGLVDCELSSCVRLSKCVNFFIYSIPLLGFLSKPARNVFSAMSFLLSHCLLQRSIWKKIGQLLRIKMTLIILNDSLFNENPSFLRILNYHENNSDLKRRHLLMIPWIKCAFITLIPILTAICRMNCKVDYSIDKKWN